MLFEFPAIVKAGITAGKYVQVISKTGVPIGMVRDSVTGKFVSHAIAATVNGNPLSPLISPVNSLIKGASMIQTHLGFTETYRQIDVVKTGVKIVQEGMGIIQATNVAGIATQGAGMVQNHMGFQET